MGGYGFKREITHAYSPKWIAFSDIKIPNGEEEEFENITIV